MTSAPLTAADAATELLDEYETLVVARLNLTRRIESIRREIADSVQGFIFAGNRVIPSRRIGRAETAA